MFARVDAALGEKLSKTIFEGPEAELTLTANAQPALMATSLAAMRALESEAGLDVARDVAFVAGHSLGEYSALCAAGALTLEDAARLLRIRGAAMQRAVPVGVGAMAAILGLDFSEVAKVAAQAASEVDAAGAVCEAANDNGGGQVVISGTKAAVERAMELAKLKGAKRALPLPVSAPFHCALMQPAAEAMAEALKTTSISAPKVPLVANVSRERGERSRRHSRQSRRASDGDRALARKRALHERSRRDALRRTGRGQGARGADQAHRRGRDGFERGNAGRRRRVQGGARRTKVETTGKASAVFDLTGKTALVTGASGGIGGAIARALHAQGASVALSGTRREALEALAGELGDARSRDAVRSRRTRTRSRRSSRPPRRRWARSTFSSTTPA